MTDSARIPTWGGLKSGIMLCGSSTYMSTWKKMDEGKDGRPTPGVKAVGKARDHWHALQEDRGELVTIRDVRSVTLEFDG